MALLKPTLSVEEARDRAGHSTQSPKPLSPPQRPAATLVKPNSDKKPDERKNKITENAAPKPKPVPVEPVEGPQRLTVMIARPAQGVSPLFDTLNDQKGPDAAMSMLMRKAFPIYDEALATGKITKPIKPFETTGANNNTTRKVSPETYQLIKQRFDPFDMERPSAIGRAYALEAIAYFLEQTKTG